MRPKATCIELSWKVSATTANSIFSPSGVLQNCGVNSDKGKSDIALFSKLISDTSSNINLLIDSLPTVYAVFVDI